MTILNPQAVSVPVGGKSCFTSTVGDLTNLGTGAAIESGHRASFIPANAFDDNSNTLWQSENPHSTNSYLGWNWSAGADTCRALIRRVGLQQSKNATNGTYTATTAVLEVSDNLTDWTLVHTFNPAFVSGDSIGPLETFDVPVPVVGAAARIRGTVFSGGGGTAPIPVWQVTELQFVENVS